MIALTAAIRDHWHAVERDLAALQLDADDIGTPKLPLCKLISIVLASHPGTAVHHFSGAWTRSEELFANFGEQQAGLVNLNARYARPQVDSSTVKPRTEFDSLETFKVGNMSAQMDSYPIDEFTVKLREKQEYWREQRGE